MDPEIEKQLLEFIQYARWQLKWQGWILGFLVGMALYDMVRRR